MGLKHFSHEHVLIEYKSPATNDDPADEEKSYASAEEEDDETHCFLCGERLKEGPSYCCQNDCKFYLHKSCADLELAPEINHPLHPSHPLDFRVKSPYNGKYKCDFCDGYIFGFVYHCSVCDFDLDVECALLQSFENFHKLEHPLHEHPLVFKQNYNKNRVVICSICGKGILSGPVYRCQSSENIHKLQHSTHKHPLIFNEKYNKKIDAYCRGCEEKLGPGPIYRCLDCQSFDLHEECADELELAPEIYHPYHLKHPLTLTLLFPPDHVDRCACSLCRKHGKGFVYYCSSCKFGRTVEEILSSDLTIAMGHQHQWTLLERFMQFTCDFCGTDGDFNPYLCTCNLVVHQDCTSLPHTIRITRHRHSISHSYSLQRNEIESKECRICFDEVDGEYGGYSCSAPDCNYIAHAKCATHEDIWDGTTVSGNEDGALLDSMNLITAVIKEIREGEDEIATEIKHAYHDHNLILIRGGEVNDDDACDGCRRAIASTPFYSCQQCIFFLHKDCAELPRQIRSPIHKHLLALFNGSSAEDDYSMCSVCRQLHSGFIYLCTESGCDFDIDIPCSLSPDTLKHPTHEHLLFLDHKDDFQGCSACFKRSKLLYRCTKRCGFALDLRCVTLPHTTRFKYDKHPLALTIDNGYDPSRLYCDLCEEERHPNHCFYYCEDCDNAVHAHCVLGEFPFVKPGSTVRFKDHSFTAVSKIWNCPPCKICGKLCNGQVFECKMCNLAIHWGCRWGCVGKPCI